MTFRSQACDLTTAEKRRLELQVALDAERSSVERNKWGQFATPPSLALDIVRFVTDIHGEGDVHFYEPSCGSGSFYSALLDTCGRDRVASAVGVELDPRFAAAARDLWGDAGLEVLEGDFLDPENRRVQSADLLVANPPYVRHHHMSAADKVDAGRMSQELTGIKPSGLSGLYVYFLLLSHAVLKQGAVSAWLIPAEFMDVNYGKALKEYLTTRVTLRRVHRFDPADLQFDDALVTSAVVVFENRPPAASDVADFTYGGTVSSPREHHRSRVGDLKPAAKWSAMYRANRQSDSGPKFADFFKIRRGIATGSKHFVLKASEAESRGFDPANLTPILPSPRHVKNDVVEASDNGYADTDPQLVVIDTQVAMSELVRVDPPLAAYLAEVEPEILKGYLAKQRKPWYKQERREPAPFVLTYMGRGVDLDKPFRFIRNRSQAIATNMFLMLYPTPHLQRYIDSDPDGLAKIHRVLLSISGEDLRNGGRVYGGGLHKMEPKELAGLSAEALVELCPELLDLGRGQLPIALV